MSRILVAQVLVVDAIHQLLRKRVGRDVGLTHIPQLMCEQNTIANGIETISI